eukprot:789647-Pyramimonas_sp.AAC.1
MKTVTGFNNNHHGFQYEPPRFSISSNINVITDETSLNDASNGSRENPSVRKAKRIRKGGKLDKDLM